jgi:putative phage-type endonuclease
MDQQKEKERLCKKVKYLQKKPQPIQKSEEWFKARQTRITASEAASCLTKSVKVCEPYVKQFCIENFKYKETEKLNPYETKQEYIIKKCEGFFGEAVFRDTVFTLWGKRYEEVANLLYARLYNTKVIEFGLLPHSRLKWLAASPDGITPEGVMLEIKCPKSRKIDETCIPIYYYIQVQIQLEVADLEECDFVECEIEEISEQDFLTRQPIGKQDKGIIFHNKDNAQEHLYPDTSISTVPQYIEWRDRCMSSDDTLVPVYYFITKYHVHNVKRSREWFANVRVDLKTTWELISRLQNNREEFLKYKDSIHMLKSKDYYEKYNSTFCLINDDDAESEFVYNTISSLEEDSPTACMINTTE